MPATGSSRPVRSAWPPTRAAPPLAPGGTIPELHQALANVADVLSQEGATLADVVKTTLYLIDMGEFAAVNDVWVTYFVDNRPTRSAVAVAALPIGARVEVEAWAYVPVPAGPLPARVRPGCHPAWPKRYPTDRTVWIRWACSSPNLARSRRTCTSTVRAPP